MSFKFKYEGKYSDDGRKNYRPVIASFLLLIFVLGSTIGGTMAYIMTHTESITNTFQLDNITYKLTLNGNAENVNMPKWKDTNQVTTTSADVEEADLAVVFEIDSIPTKEGYTFGGWYYETECSTEHTSADPGTSIEVDFHDSHVTKSADNRTVELTLYAKWTPNTYEVIYNGNGATEGTMENSVHTYDVKQNLTKNAYVREGFEFLGWSTDPTATEATYTDEQEVVNLVTENGAEVTLYAVWKQMNFTVTFDPNAVDATVDPTSKPVTYQEEYGELPVPVRDKYKFVGWTFTKDGEDYVTELTIVTKAENHTLYAKWVGDHQYTITYIANAPNASFTGGVQQVTDTKNQDATYILKSPSDLGVNRNGYVWTEWNTKSDGTGTRYLDGVKYSTNSDLTLYAIWATKTAVEFGEPDFVNMIEEKVEYAEDGYSFKVQCKTQGGADGIAIPMYNLIPYEEYRLTFSVKFNQFDFYRDDDGDAGNPGTSNGSYIFGTNIIDQYEFYDTKLSIILQDNKKTTSKYENMQWSTTEGGHFEVFLDFVPTAETMYWFWETTDIIDNQLMTYEFNSFNIQNLGPVGPRFELEDLTVTFQTAPFVDNTANAPYRWPNATNGTVRHKNYFHTEKFGTDENGLDYLEYRVFGYAGHERMTIPMTGLEIGKKYELSFNQDLSGAVVYPNLRDDQLYGCAISNVEATSDHYGNAGCVDLMDYYTDLRRDKVGDIYNHSIVFEATAETMYWQWTLGNLQDYRWSDVKLSNISIEETDKPLTPKTLSLRPVIDIELPEDVVMGEEQTIYFMPDAAAIMESATIEGMELCGWIFATEFGSELVAVEDFEFMLEMLYDGIEEEFPVTIAPVYKQIKQPLTPQFILENVTAGVSTLEIGTDYSVALTPDEGFEMSEISVEIDGEAYNVYTAEVAVEDEATEEVIEEEIEVIADENAVEPYFDGETLVIPASLITEETESLVIYAKAVEAVVIPPIVPPLAEPENISSIEGVKATIVDGVLTFEVAEGAEIPETIVITINGVEYEINTGISEDEQPVVGENPETGIPDEGETEEKPALEFKDGVVDITGILGVTEDVTITVTGKPTGDEAVPPAETPDMVPGEGEEGCQPDGTETPVEGSGMTPPENPDVVPGEGEEGGQPDSTEPPVEGGDVTPPETPDVVPGEGEDDGDDVTGPEQPAETTPVNPGETNDVVIPKDEDETDDADSGADDANDVTAPPKKEDEDSGNDDSTDGDEAIEE